jgi:hypothetical protein
VQEKLLTRLDDVDVHSDVAVAEEEEVNMKL